LRGTIAAPAVPARGRLAARAQKGDRSARARLVEQHMGLVRSIAFRYRGLGLPLEDLEQEGAIGLLTAIDEYDPCRGASFSTYGFWRARAAITHAVTAQGRSIRVPRSVLDDRRESGRARPTVASLDERDGHTTPLGELIRSEAADWPEPRAVDGERAQAVRAALAGLPDRKRAIVGRHFGLDGTPQTLIEIAADLRLSPERTRALKDEALRELAGGLSRAVAA
jgi:RNA polymerase primary sigma factor